VEQFRDRSSLWLYLFLGILLLAASFIAKMRTEQLKKKILGMTKEQRLAYYAELEFDENELRKSLAEIK